MSQSRTPPISRFLRVLPALAALAAPLFGAEPARPDHWVFQIELSSRYDSNITELSNKDRDRVDDAACQSSPTCVSRFRIESPDDVIFSPSARIEWSNRTANRVETSVRADARTNLYARNSIKNYETYALRLAQDLTPAREYETTLSLRGEWTPDFYLRELTVPEASLMAGTTIRDSARYSSNDYRAALRQVLAPKHLEAEVSYGRDTRDYDSPFDERDGDLSGWGAELTLSLGDHRVASLRAGYRNESYDADGDQPGTAAVEPDISSDRETVGLGCLVRWGHERRGSLSLSVERETRDFRSRDTADVFHFGREDTRTQERLEFRQPMGQRFYLEIGLEHEQNDSHLGPSAGSTTGDEVTDYTRNIASISTGWRF